MSDMAAFKSQDLFPECHNPEDVQVINDRCLVRTQDGHRVVLVCGIILAQYAVADRMAEAHAMVSLIEQGWADQNDVARTFGYATRTVRRLQHRCEDGGLAALARGDGYPRGRARLPNARIRLIQRLRAHGCSHREIARRLGVSAKAIRKLLRRLGWKDPVPAQTELPLNSAGPGDPNLSAFSVSPSPSTLPEFTKNVVRKPSAFVSAAAPPATLDTDPMDRTGDRLMACLGLLDDAAPLFGSGAAVPRAGVLLAMPPLVESGVFACAQKIYGSLGPAFYGLRTSLLTLILMALWRIKRPEGLKEHSPQDLGRVLGLDRAPEVKTLRRKLARLAVAGRAAQFGQALAEQRVALRGAALGFLYVDGHVRVYHGQHRLPKAHVARMRLSMPATSDYWVNDAAGDPLLVVTAEANAGLVKMLPRLLDQVRALVGERRLTVVFDRGGFSPKLFRKILEAGFDLLTYRKGRFPAIPRSRFQRHRTGQEGRTMTYLLADQEVRLLQGQLRG